MILIVCQSSVANGYHPGIHRLVFRGVEAPGSILAQPGLIERGTVFSRLAVTPD